MSLQGLSVNRQVGLPLFYKGEHLSQHRVDIIVNEAVLIEIKSVKRLEAIHTAQVLTYLRVTGLRVALILNFNSVVLKNGIRRLVL